MIKPQCERVGISVEELALAILLSQSPDFIDKEHVGQFSVATQPAASQGGVKVSAVLKNNVSEGTNGTPDSRFNSQRLFFQDMLNRHIGLNGRPIYAYLPLMVAGVPGAGGTIGTIRS